MSLDGFLVVDKPAGPTSHDVVAWARRALGTRRVGHAGTLDPFATGVLVLCVGRATRLSRFATASWKTYEGVAAFGFETDTLDSTGEPTAPPVAVRLDADAVEQASRALTGRIEQVPPMYSAKKRDGTALHRLARRGETVARDPVTVEVESWSLLEVGLDTVRFRVTCSPGTYVRVLAADLGRRLGVPAHLSSLRRLASGPFGVEDALPAAALRDEDREAAAESARSALTPLGALPDLLPSVRLTTPEDVVAFAHGRARTGLVAPEGVGPGEEVWVRGARGELLGVGCWQEDGALHPSVVLTETP